MFRRPRDPESLPTVDRSGKTCRKHGHDNPGWGSTWGYCKRCEFTIHRASGQVLYFGKFYRRVPPHDDVLERKNREWAEDYTRRTMEPDADHDALRAEFRESIGLKT